MKTTKLNQNRLIHTSKGDLEITEWGNQGKVPVIFIHGVLTTSRLWEQVAPSIGKEIWTIAPTLPLGSHKTPFHINADLSPDGVVELIIEMLDFLKIEEAIFVGNNSGGALCQMLLEQHSERVHSVVLTTCDAYDVWLPWIFKPLEISAIIPGGLFLIAQMLRFKILRRLPFTFGLLCKRPKLELEKEFVAPLIKSAKIRRDLSKFLRGISPKLTQKAALSFKHFSKPVLIVWSKDAPLFPNRLALKLKQDFPNAQLVFIENAYIFSPIDQPEVLTTEIIKHIKYCKQLNNGI